MTNHNDPTRPGYSPTDLQQPYTPTIGVDYWQVILYVSMNTCKVMGVDAMPSDVKLTAVPEILMVRMAENLTERQAKREIGEGGAFGWVLKLPGARWYNDHAVHVEG